MRKLSKIFGVALIATSMMVSVTGCSGLYNQIDDLESQLAEEKAENAKLREQLAEVTTIQEKLNELQAELDKTSKTSDDKDTTIASLTKQIADLSDEIADITQQLIVATNNTTDTAAIETEYTKKLKEANDQIALLKAEVDRITAELEAERNEITIDIKVYKNSVESNNEKTICNLETKFDKGLLVEDYPYQLTGMFYYDYTTEKWYYSSTEVSPEGKARYSITSITEKITGKSLNEISKFNSSCTLIVIIKHIPMNQ